MNYHSLTGRPTRDPEVITYHDNSGQGEMAKFTLAVNRRYSRDDKTADFFQCVAFGRQAKTVKEHVKKGKKILITGRMENNDYESDGIKVYGYNFEGDRYDIGDKFGYIKAIIDFALEREDLSQQVKEYIKKVAE